MANEYDYNMVIVEGIADKKFIEDYLKFLKTKYKTFNKTWKVFECGGNKELNKMFSNIQQHNRDNIGNDNRCLIIFDADNDYNLSKQAITNTLENNKLQAEVFLFPNNESVGDLETLLEQIVSDDKRAILKCFEGYEQCLETLKENKENPIITYTPAKKSKIYSYLEVQLDSKSKREEAKEVNRNYRDTNFWDLESPSLDNLKDFLT